MSAVEASVRGVDGAVLVTLAGRLTADNAGACLEALREARSRSPRFEIAFGEVGAVDLSILQLLCAAHRSAAAGGGAVTLAGELPAALRELSDRAGAERCAGGPTGCLLRTLRRARGAR